MRVLLDTHALLWMLEDDRSLSVQARQTLALRSCQPLDSVISLWKIAIKKSKGRLDFDRDLNDFIEVDLPMNVIDLLSIGPSHLRRAASLPFPANGHADPFDRMLVAQAFAEDVELLSADAKLDAYAIRRRW